MQHNENSTQLVKSFEYDAFLTKGIFSSLKENGSKTWRRKCCQDGLGFRWAEGRKIRKPPLSTNVAGAGFREQLSVPMLNVRET